MPISDRSDRAPPIKPGGPPAKTLSPWCCLINRLSGIVGLSVTYSGYPADGKIAKNRVHLDVHVDAGRKEAEVERLVRLGAQLIDTHDDRGPLTYVMRDPEANEFCLALTFSSAWWTFALSCPCVHSGAMVWHDRRPLIIRSGRRSDRSAFSERM